MKHQAFHYFAVLGIISIGAAAAAAADAPDTALKAAVAGSQRTAENTARDGARHPYETLTFWGLKPNQSVIEIVPGPGYWTEILAAYAKTTNGRYAATMPDESNPKLPETSRKSITEYKARFADPARFAPVRWAAWNGDALSLGVPGSADLVITARNVHDWMWEDGALDKVLKDFYIVLKPGGILAVEDHRADPRKQVSDAHDGYVNTKTMVAAVEKAGFTLEASSEINANPKDTKDYPFGVWTLPPTSTRKTLPYITPWPGQPEAATLKAPAFYQAIGESDRMTLRFRKPQ